MKIYVPADGEMCNVHHDLDCCGRKFNRPDPHIHIGDFVNHKLVARCGATGDLTYTHGDDLKLNECQDCASFNCSWCEGSQKLSDGYETWRCQHCYIDA